MAIILQFKAGKSKGVAAIYGLLNNSNLKIYIGGTINLLNRLGTHRFQIKNKTHCNAILQNDISNHPEWFEVIILEYVKDISKLKEREEFWVKFYKSHLPENGYNLTPSGHSKGQAFTMEHMHNMTSKVKGKKLPPRSVEYIKKQILSHSKKPIIQFDLNGNELRRFLSVNEAARLVVGVKSDYSIWQAVNGNQETARGFIWKYATT